MTNLLGNVEDYKKPNALELLREADKLVGRKTRRGKKKKKKREKRWLKKVKEARKRQNAIKKAQVELAKHWQEANRLMEKE